MQTQPHILLAEDDADIATGRFDALLLDNWMPQVTGIELCRRIRCVDTTTPIFFCSGAVTEADKRAAFCAGAQGYLAKPSDPRELTATLRAAVNVA